jgi:hypothetical protein
MEIKMENQKTSKYVKPHKQLAMGGKPKTSVPVKSNSEYQKKGK